METPTTFSTHIGEVAVMHPRLMWDDLIAATLVIFSDSRLHSPANMIVKAEDVPGFGSSELGIAIEWNGYEQTLLDKVRRTYEMGRLVELAAIVVAGICLCVCGKHEIRDVALRGSGADYLIDDECYLLEIAGRSRRSDASTAWNQRWQRLSQARCTGYFVCVAEFDSRTVRPSVNELLVTVKSREVQRGLLAESRGDTAASARHFLAAAHLEMVLAADYTEAGQDALALRSSLSAASCLWRAGDQEDARQILDSAARDHPACALEIEGTLRELEQSYPAFAS